MLITQRTFSLTLTFTLIFFVKSCFAMFGRFGRAVRFVRRPAATATSFKFGGWGTVLNRIAKSSVATSHAPSPCDSKMAFCTAPVRQMSTVVLPSLKQPSIDLTEALFKTIYSADVTKVAQLIQAGAKVNCHQKSSTFLVDEKGVSQPIVLYRTPLMCAIDVEIYTLRSKDEKTLVELLLEKGADPNALAFEGGLIMDYLAKHWNFRWHITGDRMKRIFKALRKYNARAILWQSKRIVEALEKIT